MIGSYGCRLSKMKLEGEIKKMLAEQKLESFDKKVVKRLRNVAINLAVSTLKDSRRFQRNEGEIAKADISFAILMDKENQKNMLNDINRHKMLEIAKDFNKKEILLKEDTFGLKIPKENLGATNYQMENPKKKMKLDMMDNKPFGNCFTFLVPPQNQKVGSFVLKNKNSFGEVPMKITIRPKFNIQQK